MNPSHVAPSRIGVYRLEERLGAGGMGIVYRAYDERLDRWVAVKVLAGGRKDEPAQRERLRREARASARLSHPAVVRIYDLVQTEEAEAIVMELVEGRCLTEVLRDGPIALAPGLVLARDVAAALAAAHAQGIVHRDLKTENVLVTTDGRAKVLDFGIAKRCDLHEVTLTDAGMVIGTYRCMAPEQAKGEEVDFKSDLFSFGVLLYELFTRKSPFLGSSLAATLLGICNQAQQPAWQLYPGLPRKLSDLIDHLLQKDPSHRPGDARAVVLALEAMSSEIHSEDAALVGEPTLPLGPLLPQASRMPAPAERRQVTAASCGLVTIGDQPLDREELIGVIPALHALVAEVVERFEGDVVPMQGRGWMACFGFPRAHEDDTRRAVSAGLEIVARSRRLLETSQRDTALRVGIHTGLMVVTSTSRGTSGDLTLSETPEIASLVESVGAPGAVTVSALTHRLIAGFFDCDELEPVLQPGGAKPLHVYRVLAESGAQTRVEAATALTQLVGRELELGLLVDRWAMAREGSGQVVLLAGEAGLGKSRLVWELRQRVAAGSSGWREAYGSSYHRDSAFHAVIELLHRWLGTNQGDSPEDRLARLEEKVSDLLPEFPHAVPLVAALLGLPGHEGSLSALSPEAQRRRTLEVLLALLLASAERQPLLLVMEDLHWFDPSSLEFLGLLIEHVAAAPLLLLLTFRPEFHPPWGERSALVHLILSPLGRAQVRLMLERLAGGRQLIPTLAEQIEARTDGVPLFVEELTKMILEAGAAAGWPTSRPGSSLDIPDTLEGWLRDRLDRLGTAREVAQLAALLGREFSFEVLAAVSAWSPELLEQALARLTEAGILYRRGLPPRHRYMFKHALIQDAAHAGLLRKDCQAWHLRIAEVLETSFAELAGSQPELLAHHYTEAGAHDRAAHFWSQAGEKAVRNSADQEAVGHLSRALELLSTLPVSPERNQREIALQVALGVAEGQARSYASPRAQQAFGRALELCGLIEQDPQIFPALRGLYSCLLVEGKWAESKAIAEQLVDLAEKEQDPFLLVTSHEGLGFDLMFMGEMSQAQTSLEKAAAHFTPEVLFPDVILAGNGSPALECLVIQGWNLWFLGFPDQAHERCREAVALAEQFANSKALVFTHHFASYLHLFRHEPDEARKTAERCLAIAEEQGHRFWSSMGAVARGFAMAAQGLLPEGLAAVREGLRTMPDGVRVQRSMHMANLAAVLREVGDVAAGLEACAEGLAISSSAGEHISDAELHRLRGELRLCRGDSRDEVEIDFREALEIARRQSAKSLELRAAMSLARLRAAQGRRAEARRLMADVYGWFTEGFETRDLRDARAVIEELG